MKRSAIFAIFFGFVVAVIGATYIALPSIVGWAGRAYLADIGFRGAAVDVDTIGLTQSTFSNIDLGPDSGVSAKKLVIDYSPGRLARRVIDGIRIEAPEVPLGVDVTGISFGALERFLPPQGGTPSGPSFRLLGPLSVTAGLLNVSTPMGEVIAALEGVVLTTDGIGTDVSLEFALQHPKARLSGRLRGILDAADQIQLTIDIQNAASEARLAFAEMTGALNVTGLLHGSLNGGGSLTFQRVSIDGVDVGNVDLAGRINGKAATAEFLMGGTGTGISLQLRAETDDIFDPAAQLHLYGESATDGLKGPFAPPVPLDVVGALAFDVRGSRRDFQGLPARLTTGAVRADDGISGTLDLTHLGIAAANGVNATLDGKLALAIDQQGWRVRPSAGLHFDLGVPSGNSERRIDLSLDTITDVPFLAGGPSAADPLRTGMIFDGVFNRWFPFSGDLGGSVWPATTDGIVFEDMALRFAPWQMRVGGMEIVAEQLGMRISGPMRQLDFEVSADARFDGTPGKGIRIAGGQISLSGSIGYASDGVRIFPDTCTGIRISRFDVEGASLRPGPISICSRSDDIPILHAVSGDDGIKRIDLAAILKSTEIALDGTGPYPVTGLLPVIEGTASIDADRRTWWARLASSGGDLHAEGPDLAISDIDATISFEGRDRLLGAQFDLASARLMDRRRPIRVSPLTVTGKGQYQPSGVSFRGDVGFGGGPAFDIDARYRMPDQRGALQLKMPKWDIPTTGPKLQELFPLLKGKIAEARGSIGGDARINWSARRTSSTAKVTLGKVAFGTSPADIAGLDGEIVFADLINLRTDGVQTLSLSLLDAGLPLENGTIKFELLGEEALRIERISWPMLGGLLEISDLSVPFDGMPDVIVANLKNLDAATLAKSVDIDGLEADGLLAGSIPVRIMADGPVIEDARIWSVKNGGLRFRSRDALESLKQSGEMASLLARALQDFRYKDIQMTLNGPLSGDITATAKLEGANPGLYDGKRIELNVTLQGALRDLLQSASVIQDLPENIRDRVQGPSGNP